MKLAEMPQSQMRRDGYLSELGGECLKEWTVKLASCFGRGGKKYAISYRRDKPKLLA